MTINVRMTSPESVPQLSDARRYSHVLLKYSTGFIAGQRRLLCTVRGCHYDGYWYE